MRRKRTATGVAALVAIATLALAACGGGNASSTAASTVGETNDVPTTETPVTGAGDTGGSADDSSLVDRIDQATADKPLEGKTYGYVKTGPIFYYDAGAEGFVQAIELLGGTAKVCDAGFDPQGELACVQDFVAQQVDGLVVVPITVASATAELRVAAAANIPAVGIYAYSDGVEDLAIGFVQASYQDSGFALGEWVAQNVPDGKIAIITGTPGRGDVEGYDEGFKEALGGDVSRIVETLNGDWDRQKAFNATQDILAKHPDVKVIFVHNEDMTAGVVAALGPRKDDVVVVSQNGSPDGETLVDDGKLDASEGWSPSLEGALAARFLLDQAEGDLPASKLCYTPQALNTKDNPTASFRWDVTPQSMTEALKTPCATTRHPLDS